MKSLIVLGIIAFLILLLYLRLRPFIRMTRQMFGFARDVRRVVKTEPASSTQGAGTSDRLVRCEVCNTWIPTSRAIRLRASNASFCSHVCLERAAEGSQRKAAS